MADAVTSPTTTREAVLAAAQRMLAEGLVEGVAHGVAARLALGQAALAAQLTVGVPVA